MTRFYSNSLGNSLSGWLRQGISPRRLALTLALGFAIGCIPVIGIPTLLCTALALALRLNMPAIQAANYAVMPLQLLLIAPFVRLGGWLFGYLWQTGPYGGRFGHTAVLAAGIKVAFLAGQALIGWVLVAAPAVVVMTLVLTLMFRRIPAVAAAETGN